MNNNTKLDKIKTSISSEAQKYHGIDKRTTRCSVLITKKIKRENIQKKTQRKSENFLKT